MQVIQPENTQNDWEIEIQAARNQLIGYTKLPFFQEKQDLKPWLIAFVGDKPLIVEEIA
jgi:hypothetical protein